MSVGHGHSLRYLTDNRDAADELPGGSIDDREIEPLLTPRRRPRGHSDIKRQIDSLLRFQPQLPVRQFRVPALRRWEPGLTVGRHDTLQKRLIAFTLPQPAII